MLEKSLWNQTQSWNSPCFCKTWFLIWEIKKTHQHQRCLQQTLKCALMVCCLSELWAVFKAIFQMSESLRINQKNEHIGVLGCLRHLSPFFLCAGEHFLYSFEELSFYIYYVGSSGLPCIMSQCQYCSKLVFSEHKSKFVCLQKHRRLLHFWCVNANKRSFPYSLPPVPIVLKLFTNRVKITSLNHLMLELICMQNTRYWIMCRKHYAVQKYDMGIMVSSSESDKLPSVWNV